MLLSTFCRQLIDRAWIVVIPWGCLAAGCWQSSSTPTDVSHKVASLPTALQQWFTCKDRFGDTPVERQRHSQRTERHPSATVLAAVPRFVDVAGVGPELNSLSSPTPSRTILLPEVMGGVRLARLRRRRSARFVRARRVPAPDSRCDSAAARQPVVPQSGRARGSTTSLGANAQAADMARDARWAISTSTAAPTSYLTNYGGTPCLQNNGDGTFTEVTDGAGVGTSQAGARVPSGWTSTTIRTSTCMSRAMDVTPANQPGLRIHQKPGYCGPGSYSSVAGSRLSQPR